MVKSRVAFPIAALAGAGTGFAIHLGTQAWVQRLVSAQMEGRSVAPSWNVRFLAAATSLEVGVATVVVYVLLRRALPGLPTLARALLLAALLLGVTGRLLRQPLMNLAIGNPLSVVLIQDGVTWMTWIALSIAVAVVYDLLSTGAAA